MSSSIYDPLDEEDEASGGPAPVGTVAGPQTARDQVMQRISQVRNSSGDEDDSSSGIADQSNEAAIDFMRNSNMTAGIGRGINALAAATGYRPDNSGYDNMEKSGVDFANREMNRTAAVKKAIADRASRAAALAGTESRFARQLDESHRHNLAMEANAGRAGRESREQKEADRELRLAVPGFERTGEVLPKDEEAQKFREATADASQLTSKLNRLKELVKTHGSFEYGGEAGQEMASLATEIQLLSKSPSMYALGVLSGPDLSILQKIASDPESIGSMFTRDSTRQAQIDAQLTSIKNKIDSKAKSLGYVASAAPEAPPAGDQNAAPKGDGGLINAAHADQQRVVVSNGQKTLSIPLKSLPEAMKDGFKVIKK